MMRSNSRAVVAAAARSSTRLLLVVKGEESRGRDTDGLAFTASPRRARAPIRLYTNWHSRISIK